MVSNVIPDNQVTLGVVKAAPGVSVSEAERWRDVAKAFADAARGFESKAEREGCRWAAAFLRDLVREAGAMQERAERAMGHERTPRL